jgi:hypothetical protein
MFKYTCTVEQIQCSTGFDLAGANFATKQPQRYDSEAHS